MKKFSRRELFRGAGAAAVGGAVLAVGLTPIKAAYPAREFKTLLIQAGSRVNCFDNFTGASWGVVQLVKPDGTLRTIIQVRDKDTGKMR